MQGLLELPAAVRKALLLDKQMLQLAETLVEVRRWEVEHVLNPC